MSSSFRTFVRAFLITAMGLLAFSALPTRADDGLCVDLAPTGDVQEVPAGMTCTIRERMVIAGRQYLFVEFNNFRRRGRSEHIALAREAVRRSVTLFNSWYQTPDAIIYFGNEPASHGTDLGLTVGTRLGCVVYIDDGALRATETGDTAANQLKRTIAHELFHCVQYGTPSMSRAMVGDNDLWWVEGTAEYFAGLAFPESRPGGAFYIPFTAGIFSKPLYELKYEAYPFFAFLHRKRGANAILEFLRHPPARGDAPSSRAALQSISGIDELFSEFNRAFFEGLEDESGRPLPVPSVEVEEIALTGSRRVTRQVIPYSFGAQRFTAAENSLYRFDAPTGPARAKAYLADTPGVWRQLPTQMGSCQHDTDAILVYTSTVDADGPLEAVFQIQSEPPQRLADCQCPIGAWTISNLNMETMRASPRHELTRPGRVSMTFHGDGTAHFDANGVVSTVRIAIPSGGTSEAIIERNYLANWNWTVRNGVLVMTQTEGMTITETRTSVVSGAVFGSTRRTEGPKRRVLPLDASSGRERKYACRDNKLTIGPPIVRVGPRVINNDARALNYPHWGIFERQ